MKMNKEVKQAIIDSCCERIERDIEQISAKILNDLTDANYGGLRQITDKVAEKIAQRFYEENYEKIVSSIDVERVAKMAEFSAIGKALNR
jgi:rubrerythrin